MQQGGLFFGNWIKAYSLAILLMTLGGCMGGAPHVPAPVEIHTPRPLRPQQEWSQRQSIHTLGDNRGSFLMSQEQRPQQPAKMGVKTLPPPPLTAASPSQTPPLSGHSASKLLFTDRETVSAPSLGAREAKVPQVFPAELPVEPPISPETISASQKKTPSSVPQDPKFLWPVLGNVVAPFGPTADGLHNDGINIKVRKGTPIRSAAPGTVVFASENVKGFGQLILIKHTKGWTSAYAHLQKTVVKKNDQVKQAQVIAYSGDSGTVQFPQLHFELRKDVKAVDPLAHLVPQ